MSTFSAYFLLGLEHLLDWAAVDHILFILVMCAAYRPSDWKKLGWMVTAFTIGHSITLGLSIAGWVVLPELLIEVLIPVTIMGTAVINVLLYNSTTGVARSNVLRYGTVAFFGLIHGMGFSNLLRSMMIEGEGLWDTLLPFNLGIEVGQLVILALVLLLMFVWLKLLRLPHKYWNYGVSGMAFLISVLLILQKF